MPRTTLDIDATVLRELRRRQRKGKETLGQLVSGLLAKALADPKAEESPPPLDWPSQNLRPRVDLDDKEAVWRILDER